MAGQKAKGGKKNRKLGRKKAGCEKYRREDRETKNRARKMARHIKKYPGDKQADGLLKKLLRGEK